MLRKGNAEEDADEAVTSQSAATLGLQSNVGRVRRHNEDSFAAREDIGLWIVADGMGGAAAGEVASAIVVDVVPRAVEQGADLPQAIAEANRSILDAAASGRGKPGMGSTVVAARLDGRDYTVAWVGDARAYIWGDRLQRLSRDHSRVQELLDAGMIDESEARNHPHRSVITRVLGGPDGTAADSDQVSGSLEPGQGLLLCSDGLTSEVSDEEIAEILSSRPMTNGEGQAAVDRLVSLALDHGGNDNVTVVLVGLSDAGGGR
ncbi:protein phosphatase 2C domain-containing protein [Pelagibius sp. CAU 1746]|uniref:PP2C family protein-serine/threonine phosphatase n=1 Tax=Pelagibius sp. CAU 1746 TaxID=3140370 RepID=UPI00325B3451